MHLDQSNPSSRTKGVQVFLALLAVVLGLSLGATHPVFAQNARIKHVVTKQKKVAPAMGRELYFALPQNYEDQSGKYFILYVTSPKYTTIKVESAQGTQVKTVLPYAVAQFDIPISWEMKSNDLVEDKGIRVYSNDADITGYLMSHNPYTSDGMYVFPTIGWGTDYVVAAYASLDAGFWDYPSEFVIVANHDGTLVEITPSTDLRGASATVAKYPAGKKFTVSLNRGQSIQYKCTGGGDVSTEDVTGTFIHSTNFPIGVIGASQCPDIPLGYPYCDHVLDMMPPTRTWATSYYTAPTISRKKGDTFLTIASAPGQVIKFQGSKSGGPRVKYQFNNAFEIAWDNDVAEAAKWTSDKPFFLVQYLNSSTWDCDACGFGDPAEVVVNPVENYTKKVVFQTPTSIGSQAPYQNYVNIIVNDKAAAKTTFNGKSILTYTKMAVDNIYSVYRITNVKPGTHVVESDSGVGVYVYGYGSYESYAWTGSFGTGTYGSPDTVPPAAITNGECFNAHVKFSDVEPLASKLNQVRLDSVFNMAYLKDPQWLEGIGIDSTYYDMYVVDPSQEAYLQVTTFDLAGNSTTVTSTYQPQTAVGSPDVISFGTGSINTPPAIIRYDTITNTGKVPFTLDIQRLILNNQGFTIDSGLSSDPIPVGGKRILRIAFIPKVAKTVTDTLLFGDACLQQKVLLLGNGGAPDFAVTDGDWLTQTIGGSQQLPPALPGQKVVNLINLSSSQIVTITGITSDNGDFTFDESSALPIVLKPSERREVLFTFHATKVGHQGGHGTFVSKEAGQKTDSLHALVVEPGQVFYQDTTITVDCAKDGDSVHLVFTVEATGDAPTHVKSWTHTNTTDPEFRNFQAVLQNGQVVTSAQTLTKGTKMFITEDFIFSAGQNKVWNDQITATDEFDKPIKTVSAQLSTTFRTANVLDQALDYGIANYGDPKTMQTVRVVNTAQQDLTITNMSTMGGQFAGAFTVESFKIIHGTQVSTVTLPTTLAYLDTLVATVSFDPSFSSASQQLAAIGVDANACNVLPRIDVKGGVVSHGLAVNGFDATSIFTCSQNPDNVITLRNPQGVDATVVEATIEGPNASAFTIANGTVGATIPAKGTIPGKVLFTPPGAGTFTGTLRVVVRNTEGTLDSAFSPISATAGNAVVAAASNFAVQSDKSGNVVQLPIKLNLDKGGVAESFSAVGVNMMRLTYALNTDLLSFPGNNVASAINNLSGGWKVDPTQTTLKNNQMVLVLTNPNAMDDNIPTDLGAINLEVRVPKNDVNRDVKLQSLELFNGSLNNPVQGCVSTNVSSGQFSLIYQCGEQTMQKVMAGQNVFGGFIHPATPNPVTPSSSVMTFDYMTHAETPITITIMDLLGNEVARVVNNVDHQAGAYSVSYDASKLPSGTYTYRISGKGFVSSKQFVVTR